jgi:hypothetical protein
VKTTKSYASVGCTRSVGTNIMSAIKNTLNGIVLEYKKKKKKEKIGV